MKNFICIFFCCLVTACATKPSKISAQYVSPLQYKDYDCDQISLEQARIERRSNELYASLKKEANADAWQMGIGIVLFWPTLLMLEGGDGPEATEYSRLRGEYNAIEEVSISKKCSILFKDDLKDVLKEQEEKETGSEILEMPIKSEEPTGTKSTF